MLAPCSRAIGLPTTVFPYSRHRDVFQHLPQASILEGSGVQNPLNMATAFLDLDFMYGRSEAEAEALRTMEDGFMTVSDDGMPLQNDDGTWLVS